MRIDGTDVKRRQRGQGGRRRAEPPRVSRRVVQVGRPAVPVAAVPVAALLAAGLLLAGCVQPLAVQDPFMNPLNATGDRIGERISGAVAEGRARQAVAQACSRRPRDGCPPGPAVAPRSDPRAVDALDAWEKGEAKQPAGEVAPASL